MIFLRILAPTWPQSWHQIGQLWQHLACIFALLQPSLVNMAPGRLPDLPKHPPDLNFLRFLMIFGMIFDTFLDTLFQTVIDNFSGNSAMQPLSETSRFKLFSTFFQRPSRNTFHTRGSSSKIAKLRGPAVTHEASSIYIYIYIYIYI